MRTCFGLRDAALGLGAPLISGKDSMKNDYSGKRAGVPIRISVPPTLLMTAIGKIPDLVHTRMTAMQSAGDGIYLVGALVTSPPSLAGSEFAAAFGAEGTGAPARADWALAARVYRFLSAELRQHDLRLSCAHDVSDGGVLTTLVESLIGTPFGANVDLSGWRALLRSSLKAEGAGKAGEADDVSLEQLVFGEGFHSFVISVSPENEARFCQLAQASGVPVVELGRVTTLCEVREAHQRFDTIRVDDAERAWQSQAYGARAEGVTR
jgi:phosphoribosylformylglycinamidine (FGAM) synthase-like enzyme